MITLNFFEEIQKIPIPPSYPSLLKLIQTAYQIVPEEMKEISLMYEDNKFNPINLTQKTFKEFHNIIKALHPEETKILYVSVTSKSTLFKQDKKEEFDQKEKEMKSKGKVIKNILEEIKMKRSMKKEEDQRMTMLIDNIVYEKLIDTKRAIIRQTVEETSVIANSVIMNNDKTLKLKGNNRSICNSIHQNICCDGCGEGSIKGIRYKCVECDNFNYCCQCEEEKGIIHKHPFYILRYPIN